MRTLITLLILSSVLYAIPYRYPKSEKINPKFASFFIDNPSDSVKVWILFTDKGFKNKQEISTYIVNNKHKLITSKSLKRRQKRKVSPLLDFYDIPVYKPYIKKIEDLGLNPICKSRYLNAITCYVRYKHIKKLLKLPFVYHLKKVARSVFRLPKITPPNVGQGQFDPFYGYAYEQVKLMGIPTAHSLGFTGKGIIICMLDTGFRLTHESLQHIDLKAEYDFINNDANTDYEAGQDTPDQPKHGTMTLSILAGYKPGKLVGPAFEATFLLAKTEYVPDETQEEEDFWVAGIEWADSMGADVVNSSLGYIDWYEYSDLDGHTCLVTIAAAKAAQKGILLCNSMGNEGNYEWDLGTLIAPADADSIIALGATDLEGHLASFSSTGPTYDGRIKPELVAPGTGVSFAYFSFSSTNEYAGGSGTSFSSPLTAGAVALVLQAFPNLSVPEIIALMKTNADKKVANFSPGEGLPNNYYGWGITYIANILSSGRIYAQVNKAISGKPIEGVRVSITGNENKSGTTTSAGGFSEKFTLPGSYKIHISKEGYRDESAIVEFNGKTGIGYTFSMVSSDWKTGTKSCGVFPNPSNGDVFFGFELTETVDVTVRIYSMNGTLLKEITEKQRAKGIYLNTANGSAIFWNGIDKNNKRVGSGIYLYTIQLGNVVENGRFAIVK